MPTRPLLLVLAMLSQPTSISQEEIGRPYGEGVSEMEQKEYAAAADPAVIERLRAQADED